MIENVRGTIIGGDPVVWVALVAPNGNIQRTGTIPAFPTHSATDRAIAWAREMREALFSVQCGDGLPLRDHPEILEECYGKGEWDVRIHDQ